MVLTMHEMSWFAEESQNGNGSISQYRVGGLPAGEQALIAEFPHRGWRILRWNDEWHGNWTGQHATADAALEALRQELLAAVA